MPSSKMCQRCKQILPLDSFCKKKGRKDGHSNWCKACSSSYFVNRYHTNLLFRQKQIEYVGNYNRTHQEKRRQYYNKSFKQYRQNNAEKLQASKKISLLLTKTGLRDKLWERASGRCEMCGIPLTRQTGHNNYAIHHKDGNRLNNVEENLIVVCTKCHLHKLHPRSMKA